MKSKSSRAIDGLANMIHFTKMHGIGNDYILVDCFKNNVRDPNSLSKAISDRHYGVGADGLILVSPPENDSAADLRMRIFNADGGEAEMCGNGIRCVSKFAHDRGLCDAQPMRIETGAGVLCVEYVSNGESKVTQATVDMGEPILNPKLIPVDVDGVAQVVDYSVEKLLGGFEKLSRMTCVSMGNPHAVFYCDDLARIPLAQIGPKLCSHEVFPKQANIHFVQIQSTREVTMRTWERGSGITLGCGTGAAAVCVAGVLTNNCDRDVLIHLPGGDLSVRWDESTNHVFTTGPAAEIFSGEWDNSKSV